MIAHTLGMFIAKFIVLFTTMQLGTSIPLLTTNVVQVDGATADVENPFLGNAENIDRRRASEAIRTVPRQVELGEGQDCASLGAAVTDATGGANPFWCVCSSSDGTAKCSTGKTCGSDMCWNAQNVYRTRDNATYTIESAFVCLLSKTEEVPEGSTKPPLVTYCFQLMYDDDSSADAAAMVNCTGFYEGYCNSCQPCGATSTSGNNVLLDTFKLACSNTADGPKSTSCVTLDSLIDEYGAGSTSGGSQRPRSWGVAIVTSAVLAFAIAASYT